MNLILPAILCALFVIESNAVKPRGRRGRSLHELEITELDNCSNELYQISGKTSGKEGHVLLVAKPECNESEGEACTCPLLSFDSGTDDNGNVDNAIQVMTGAGDDTEALNLGAFPLSTILDAFTTASVKNSGTEYDFLDNNCASFMISMLVELGIDLSDKKIISFTVQQISSEFLLNKLLEADTEKNHNDIYDSQNDAVVVEEFISNYILERI